MTSGRLVYPEGRGISEHLESASWRLELPGGGGKMGKVGKEGRGSAEIRPGNHDIWVEVPALLVMVVVVINFFEHLPGIVSFNSFLSFMRWVIIPIV